MVTPDEPKGHKRLLYSTRDNQGRVLSGQIQRIKEHDFVKGLNMNENQKTYMDWVYGKIQGMLEALKCQCVITDSVYETLGDLVHQTDRYREALERMTSDNGGNYD